MSHSPSHIKADCIVLGVGSMGSAACYYLAKRGYSVIGLEQFGIVHDQGAHGGQSRIIRKAYFEHPNYIPLLQQAYRNWQEIERLSNRKIYHPTGLLYAGPRSHPLIESVKASAMAYHIPLEDYSMGTNNRFPLFDLPSDSDIVYEPEAGFLRPDEAIRTFTQMAESKGANILTDVKVTGWKKEGNGVMVTTSKETFHADRLVITAGPWSAKLIPGIKEKLTVTRQVLAWIQPEQPGLFSPDSFPCWFIVEKDGEGAYYGFPWINDPATNMTGIKVAYHHRGTPSEPDKVNREITEEDTDHLLAFIQKHLPQAMGKIHFSKTCLYSYSPDEHFIIDHIPDTEGRVSMAWGFSGHGFKFASAVGEILADLAIDGRTLSPIDFLRADRLDH